MIRWSNSGMSKTILKTIDETVKQKERQKRTKRWPQNYSERELNYCAVFKLGFFLLIRKASFICKSNSELDLSTVLKETWLYKSKHAMLEWKLKKNRFFFPFEKFPNPGFQMTTFN